MVFYHIRKDEMSSNQSPKVIVTWNWMDYFTICWPNKNHLIRLIPYTSSLISQSPSNRKFFTMRFIRETSLISSSTSANYAMRWRSSSRLLQLPNSQRIQERNDTLINVSYCILLTGIAASEKMLFKVCFEFINFFIFPKVKSKWKADCKSFQVTSI